MIGRKIEGRTDTPKRFTKVDNSDNKVTSENHVTIPYPHSPKILRILERGRHSSEHRVLTPEVFKKKGRMSPYRKEGTRDEGRVR